MTKFKIKFINFCKIKIQIKLNPEINIIFKMNHCFGC
jgi:hypothetical protein